MKHTDIRELFSNSQAYLHKEVTVCGWVRTSAQVKPMVFIQLNDGTTVTQNLQLTIDQSKYTEEEFRTQIKPMLTLGASLKAVGIPAVEVHISDVDAREPFRQISYAGMACVHTIKGHGFEGYREAILYLKEHYA